VFPQASAISASLKSPNLQRPTHLSLFPSTGEHFSQESWIFFSSHSNRQVLFFVDNTACRTAYVHGYVRSPHMTALSNTLHLALTHLKCHVWWEYVSSQTNGADFPSRIHCTEPVRFYNDEGYTSPMCLPSFDDLRFPCLEDVEYWCFGLGVGNTGALMIYHSSFDRT
jgi:hypothetical protein